jgi:hypothetical protein
MLMKRFAVSVTFHQIDETDLDSTTLEIVSAPNVKEAAFKTFFAEMLENDTEFQNEVCNGEYEPCPEDGLGKDVLGLPKKEFAANREKYWRKRWNKRGRRVWSGTSYDFYFDDQDGLSCGVYGLMVLGIKP